MNTTVWTTRDGRKIPLVEMSSDHIQHCIEDLLNGTIRARSLDVRDAWVRALQQELVRREQ